MQLEARLRAFAALARRGSFSAAADELVVSQPAVSKHIAELEAELGQRLVTRTSRGTHLTAAGEVLAEYVQRAEALLAQAEREVAARASGAAVLAIAASGNPLDYLLPRALGMFARTHPAVSVSVLGGTSAQAATLVRAHRAELGVVGGFASAPDLEAEPVLRDEIIVVGPPEWRARRVSIRDLADVTWISREAGSSTRDATEAAWRDLGIAPIHVVELPSWEAVKLAAANGVGIAVCSTLAVESELRSGSLARVRVPRWRVHRTISVIRPKGVTITTAAEGFLTALRCVADELARPSRRNHGS